jgi:hypothetical protein
MNCELRDKERDASCRCGTGFSVAGTVSVQPVIGCRYALSASRLIYPRASYWIWSNFGAGNSISVYYISPTL